METTERIVEAYARYVKGWATIPNIRCAGQYEIDLLAFDPLSDRRYHIEVGVSVSGGFSKLNAKPFDPNDLKERVKVAPARRTLGYFAERKFASRQVKERLEEFGCRENNTTPVIVTWGWVDGVPEQAAALGIELWDFRSLMREIADSFGASRAYFTDDTLRTLHLFSYALPKGNQRTNHLVKDGTVSRRSSDNEFWVYENHVHDYARIHRGSCPYCQQGAGMHGVTETGTGGWVGPFTSLKDSEKAAKGLEKSKRDHCGHCLREMSI